MINLKDFKDWLLMIGSVLASIVSSILIYNSFRSRPRIEWYARSKNQNQVIWYITNLTNTRIKILGLFYERESILKRKDRKKELNWTNTIQSSLNQMLAPDRPIDDILKKRKIIELLCITEPKLENKVFNQNSTIEIVLKTNILNEKIVNLFLRDSIGDEWYTPKKVLKKIRKYLLKDKIRITAKIKNEKRKSITNTQIIIFKMENDEPQVERGKYGDVQNDYRYGYSWTNINGKLVIYINDNTLTGNEEYILGTGSEFAVKKEIFGKKRLPHTFNIDKDLKKKEIKLGKIILGKLNDKEKKK